MTARPMEEERVESRKVTVCSACLRACCWQGSFMCDYAEGASTVEKTIAELRAGKYGESEHYWLKEEF